MEKNIITGNLDPFFETGTEGIIWTLYDETKEGYDGLCSLNDGDHLSIYNDTKTEIVWAGIINFDWETNRIPYPNNPEYGQQAISGYWVHGVQNDVNPEQWGKWFFSRSPAELIKGPIGVRMHPVKSSIIEKYHFTPIVYGVNYDLIIKFKNGSFYKYKSVSHEDYIEFAKAESKGIYLGKFIKGKYDFEKLVVE